MKTTPINHLEKAYEITKESSKSDGHIAIVRRELYYAIEKLNGNLPMNCVGSLECGIDGACFSQISGQGFCK